MTLPLRPSRGGFLRPFGCGQFIREFLLGLGPHGSPCIDLAVGAPQTDIFYHYKQALIRATAEDRAVRAEERQAKKEKRAITPERIEDLTRLYLSRIPYKTTFCRYHSFVVYFSNLRRLGWVEPSGRQEDSTMQQNYPPAHPRIFYRLTLAGKTAPASAWANPLATLYRKP